MKLRITLLALTAILIAVHFLRSFAIIPMLICLTAPFILLIKRRWSLITVQVLTVVAAVIWLNTLNGIVQQRVLEGRSWTASAIILGFVTAYTLLAGWLLNSQSMKEKYL